jgi:hypothetical protein
MPAAFFTVLAANLTNCLVASNSLSSRLRPSSPSPSAESTAKLRTEGAANPLSDCLSCKGQHVARDCLERAGDGSAGRRAHRAAKLTVRFLDGGAEDAIELFLVCDFTSAMACSIS